MSSTANCKRENTKKTIFFRNEAVRMFAERYDLFFLCCFYRFPVSIRTVIAAGNAGKFENAEFFW